MHRHTRSDTGDISSPRSSRAPSFSSDRPSVAGSITFQMPSSVRPSPAYIAASVASQIVTDHHNARLREDMDSDHDDDAALLANALFSEQALCLLNAFLDHLLFAFLSTGRSPSLTAIRPAVAEVLKPRLAREAMEAADEELQGLLAGEDEDEFPVQDGKIMDKWDVEKVWKRTRLRIMVYTRLGELEDEDEERYVEQERGLSMDEDDSEDAGLVSWASAIFLTSVIEFIAEQTLLVSGQAAYARTAAKLKRLAQKSNDPDDQIPERIVVEEPDVEKIALNSALGRLWRTWRKRVRSPIQPLSPGRSLHYMSSYTSLNSLHRRRRSHDTADESILNDDVTEVPEHKPTETEIAANIPLPMGDNDVNEIEVPGLARTYEDAESSGTQTPIARPQRPSSFIMLAPAESFRMRTTKVRPVSMPPPAAVPFEVPARSVDDEESQLEPQSEQYAEPETPFETPMERPSDDESYIHEEEQESIDLPKDQQTKSEPWREEPSKLPIVEEEQGKEEVVQNEDLADEQVDKGKSKEEVIDDELNADLVAFAASTGMGYRMSAISPVDSSFPRREDSHALTPIPSAQSVQSFESETPEPPKVMQLKRMSIEKTGPPVVRTSSVRSTSSRIADRKPVSTPEPAKEREGTSYLYDDVSDEDMAGPSAIGVAHTSNVPIRTSPSPSEDHVSTNGKAKQPAAAHGRYVEVQPRQTTTTSIAVRKAPAVEVEEKPTAPVVADRSTQRKEVPRKEVASGSTSTLTRAESPLSAPRKRDVTPPKSRGTVLSSLQEADGWSEDQHQNQHQQQQPTLPEKSAQRGSPARGSPASNSPKTSVSYRNREAPAAVAERQYRQTSNEESTHSRSNTAEGSPEKATLQRVSSSSSTTRSAGTSILYTGRDSEASVNGRPRGLSGRMSEEDRERQFDTLVKGQETVKYTLTPQSMRDMDEPVVVKRVEPHKPISSVTVYPRVNADKDSSFGSSHLPAKTAVRHEGPTAQTNRASPSRKVLAKPLAREPRIQSESMRDFADFIRSTGPAPGEERPVQPFVALGGPKAKPANSTNGSLTSLTRKKSTKSGSSHSQTPSTGGEGPTLKPRVHMEPRSPGGQRSGNDDLIDFIRQGPPNSNNGQPRIPRSVAPFRTTVDSDQFDRMLDDNGNVESAYGSQVSTISKHSTQTSNSRTGLLPASNVVQPAYSNAPQKLSGSMASNAEPNIQRTRRRVKDPYAIDLSDDEDDDMLTALPSSPQPPAPQQPKQESLMDFLNGMEPPPTSKPEPFILSKETIAAARARANSGGISNIKTNSSPNLGMRNGASAGPMQSGSNTSSIISDAPRAHKPRLQARVAGNARDSRSGRTATDDLADFLRNSGPIEPPAPSPATAARKEEGKRSNTRFWRKKTSTDA